LYKNLLNIVKRKSVGGVTDYQTSASHMQEL
jgi:hypothetical protein